MKKKNRYQLFLLITVFMFIKNILILNHYQHWLSRWETTPTTRIITLIMLRMVFFIIYNIGLQAVKPNPLGLGYKFLL